MTRKMTLTASTLVLLVTLTLISPLVHAPQLTTDTADDRFPSIIQTNDGKIWVAWQSSRTDDPNIFYKTYNGASWSADEQLTRDRDNDEAPSIMQDATGKIWVVWMSNRTGNCDLFYQTSSDGGTHWLTKDTQLTTNVSFDGYPSIIQASNGTIWVVWESDRTVNENLFYKTSSNGGVSWSAEKQLTTDPNSDWSPSIMQAINGTFWLVWSSNRTGNEDLFFKTSNDGSSWSPEIRLTTDSGSDRFPSIMQDANGTVWLAWQTHRSTQDDIFYKTYNGLSWSPENQLTWFMENDITPSIYQTSNQTIWLVWASDKAYNFDIYYKFVIIDVAIKSVTTSSKSVPQGDSVNINVDVQNEGTAGATFTVTAYRNGTLIGTQQKTLIPTIFPFRLTFMWNTTGVTYGNYTISAQINHVIGEVDTADNAYTDGTFLVTIRGDVDRDGNVDSHDLYLMAEAYGSTIGEPAYKQEADLDNDGNVDSNDLQMLSAAYGEKI